MRIQIFMLFLILTTPLAAGVLTPPVEPGGPPILIVETPNGTTVPKGGEGLLRWETRGNPARVTMSNDGGTPYEVDPSGQMHFGGTSKSWTYTLRATNAAGSVSKTVTFEAGMPRLLKLGLTLLIVGVVGIVAGITYHRTSPDGA